MYFFWVIFDVFLFYRNRDRISWYSFGFVFFVINGIVEMVVYGKYVESFSFYFWDFDLKVKIIKFFFTLDF